tara:strand:+ start:90 stop:530 length:441 start_codon:yes stop_codon:yes gene_type:complete
MSIFLGGTTSSNELKDYEEGTFSVSLSVGSNSNSTGHYVKIGDIVLVSGEETCDNNSSGSTVVMNGLPFTALATSGYHNYLGSVRGYNWNGFSSGKQCINCCIHGNGTDVQFGTLESDQAWSMLKYNSATSTNNSLRWTCVYRTTT